MFRALLTARLARVTSVKVNTDSEQRTHHALCPPCSTVGRLSYCVASAIPWHELFFVAGAAEVDRGFEFS